jgi:predicted permease
MARFLRLPRSPSRIRADIDAEFAFDIEMHASDLERQGLDADAARRRAAAEFGDLETTRRYCEAMDMATETDTRRTHYLEELASDLVIVRRGMRRNPLFALVVLITLALGIGANTAVFSVLQRVLITPLPYRDPGQLYRLYTTPSAVDGDDDKLSLAELQDLAAQSRTLAGVTESGNYGSSTYTDGRTAEPWRMAQVAMNFFEVLGTRPIVGRTFVSADLATGAPRATLVSYEIWQRLFAGSPSVLDRRIQIDNVDYTIVGVLPKDFVFPDQRLTVINALRPLPVDNIMRLAPAMARSRSYRGIARLRQGVSRTAMLAELSVLRGHIQADFPELKHAGVVRPVPLHDAVVGDAGPVLRLVMAAALLVLLVTCVNVAGLFLSRGAAQRREIGVRTALGAGRGRLVRQVLTEGLAYGVAGGAAGIAIAGLMKRLFVALAGSALPQVGEVRIDRAVLGFAIVVSIVSGVTIACAPAVAATRVDVRDILGETAGRSASLGRSWTRVTRGLVSVQIAFAVVLLVGAGLLTRTFLSLVRTNVGYDGGAHALTFGLNLPGARYHDDASRAALANSLVARIHALPGVTAVGYTRAAPWQGSVMNLGLSIEGRTNVDTTGAPTVEYATASDEFFSALGVPLLSGRIFTPNDHVGSPSVIVISQSVARRFWPNANPLGARVRFYGGGPPAGAVLEVVGVVGDVRESVTADPAQTVYASERQWPGYGGTFVVRTRGNERALLPSVEQAVHDLDPSLPLFFSMTVHDVLHAAVARQELGMALMAAFAALALVLAALGVYGVMAYAVVARTREFGIRAALGAPRGAILTLVAQQMVATVGVGLVAGVAIAAMLSRFVASMLAGVSTHDAVTFVGAPLLLLVVAVAGCALPAHAAARIDPVDALRSE